MKLTRTERWILVNQYRILERLDPENAEYYKEARAILEEGYELLYEDIDASIFRDEHVMSSEDCTEVIDILAMFDALQHSYDALPDKSTIEDWKINFVGFDGNNETAQMAFARFYSSYREGRFVGLRHVEDFNSHAPTLDRYRRMLRRWQKLGQSHSLSEQEIKAVVEGN